MNLDSSDVRDPHTSSSTPHSRTLLINPDSSNKAMINITSELSSTPSYTILTSKSKPNLTLTSNFTTPPSTLGTAIFHRLTSFTTDLLYNSRKISIHPSTTTYSHDFYHPTYGALQWAPRGGEKGRGKDLELKFLRDGGKGEPLAVLEAPKLVGKEGEGESDGAGTKLRLMEGVWDEDLEGLAVFSAVAIGVRGHGKSDFMGAALGFGAVGI